MVLMPFGYQVVGPTNSIACQISNATDSDLLQPDGSCRPLCWPLCGPRPCTTPESGLHAPVDQGHQKQGPLIHPKSLMPLTTTCCSQIAVAVPFITSIRSPSVLTHPQTLAHMQLSIKVTRSRTP